MLSPFQYVNENCDSSRFTNGCCDVQKLSSTHVCRKHQCNLINMSHFDLKKMICFSRVGTKNWNDLFDKLLRVEKMVILCLEQYWACCQTWLCPTEKTMFGIQNETTSKNREVRRGLLEGGLIPLSIQTSLKCSSRSASLFFQWWANPRGRSGTQGLLAKDVQVTECSEWYQ